MLGCPQIQRQRARNRIHFVDKNFTGFLIIWDRLFGTFYKDEPPPIDRIDVGLDDGNRLNSFHEWQVLWQIWGMGLRDAITYPIKFFGKTSRSLSED